MATAELPAASSGSEIAGIASLANLFLGKTTNTNTNTGTTTNGSTSTNGNTTGNASTQNSGGIATTGTTTTSDNVSPDAVNAVVKSILEGSSGIAAIASGEKRAGLYNSSTNNLMINDLLARAAAEGAKLNKTTTVTTNQNQADSRATTSTQQQNTTQQQQNTQQQNSVQAQTQQVAPQIKPSTGITAAGGLTALGQLANTAAGQKLLESLGLGSLIKKGAKQAATAVASKGTSTDGSTDTAKTSDGTGLPNGAINSTPTVAADGSPAANPFAAPITRIGAEDAGSVATSNESFAAPITRIPQAADTGNTDLGSVISNIGNVDGATALGGSSGDISFPGDAVDAVAPVADFGTDLSFDQTGGFGGSDLGFDNADFSTGQVADVSNGDVSAGSSSSDSGSLDFGGGGIDFGSGGGFDGSLDVNSGGGDFGDLFNSGGSALDFGSFFDFAEGGLVTKHGNANKIAKHMKVASSKSDNDADDRGYAEGGLVSDNDPKYDGKNVNKYGFNGRENYTSRTIEIEDAARKNYENSRGTPDEKPRYEDLKAKYDRTVRALNQPDAGAGRGNGYAKGGLVRTGYASGGNVDLTNVGLRINPGAALAGLDATSNTASVANIRGNQVAEAVTGGSTATPATNIPSTPAPIQQPSPSVQQPTPATPTSGGTAVRPNVLTPELRPGQTGRPRRPGNTGTLPADPAADAFSAVTNQGGSSGEGDGIATGETGPVTAAEATGFAVSAISAATGVPVAALNAVVNAIGLPNQAVPLSPVTAITSLIGAISSQNSIGSAAAAASASNTAPSQSDQNAAVANAISDDNPNMSPLDALIGVVDDAISPNSVVGTPDADVDSMSADDANAATSDGPVSSSNDASVGNDAGFGGVGVSDGMGGVGDSDGGVSSSGDSSSGNDGSSSGGNDGSSGSDGGSDGGSSGGGDGGGDGGGSSGGGDGGGGEAEGGPISGSGTDTSDSIDAQLSDGEFVLNATAVKAVGVDFLNRINDMFKPSPAKLAQGKKVKDMQRGR